MVASRRRMTVWAAAFVSVTVAVVMVWAIWLRPSWVIDTCRSNMKQLAAGLGEFHDQHGHFPPAWSDTEPAVSWRTALLPHVGEVDLYQQYNMAAAWDDASNTQVLNQRPALLACPNVDPATHTAYQAVVGFNTAWPYQNHLSIQEFYDGNSNTIQVIESHSPAVAWTSTDDTKWTTAFREMPPSGHGGVVFVAMADGTVRAISTNIDRSIWQQLLTPQGGRPIAGKTFSEDLTAELEELMNGGQKAFAPPVAASSLSSTQMMPFMDANIEVGENMIYCPTFALAWSKYKTLITQQAETEFGKRISDVPFTPDDINSAAVTIMAGSLSADDLAAVNSKLPPMPMGGPVAYCQLKKQLPFIAEFEPFANPLTFATATGNIDVRSFGVTSGWDQWGKALGQIQVLDYRSPDDFIIRIGNLPGESLVLAKMPKPATIAEGIRAMEAKIASTNVEGDAVGVVSGEQVVIPILEFSLMEDFTERLQHSAQPAGSRLLAATQLIQFRLDETGAVLFSEAAVIGENGHYEYKVGERTFIFDKPFLLVLQQTTKTNPYFAAWVANGDVMAVVGAATE